MSHGHEKVQCGACKAVIKTCRCMSPDKRLVWSLCDGCVKKSTHRADRVNVAVIEWADHRIEEMLSTPKEMWGNALAIELQLLVVLEARAVAQCGRDIERLVIDAWSDFLDAVAPGSSVLADRIGVDSPEYADAWQKFVAELDKKVASQS